MESNGSVESWQADTGETRWKTESDLGKPWPTLLGTQLAATADACYLGGGNPVSDNPDFALYAFSASSGRLSWSLPLEDYGGLPGRTLPLAAVPGTVFLATSDAVYAVPEA